MRIITGAAPLAHRERMPTLCPRAANSSCDAGRDTLVQQQVAAIPGMIVEARNQMPGLEAGRFHRLLRVIAELTTLKNNLDQALLLVVAAGRGKRQERLASAR